MTDTPKKPRQSKSDQQRARERLGVEERRVTKLEAATKKLKDAYEESIAELASATERRDYARKDPALKHGPSGGASSTAPTTVPTGAQS
jgi:hypothetical protein